LKVCRGEGADFGNRSAPDLDFLRVIGIKLNDADTNVVALGALFCEELIHATDDIGDERSHRTGAVEEECHVSGLN
jgi:hypothetical protein